MASLCPDQDGDAVFSSCRARVQQAGMALTSSKVGHSTGLDFLKTSVFSQGTTAVLEPGTALAFDYGTDPVSGFVLHVVDRVIVTDDGVRRLFSRGDPHDPYEGFRTAMEVSARDRPSR